MTPNPRRIAAPAAPKAIKATFWGPLPLNVGGSVYGIPRGSTVAHAANERITYVLLPGRDLRALTKAGEVIVPSSLRGALLHRYFPG